MELYLGDCLEILPKIPDNSIDAVITDVPYGTTACKWDVIIPLEPMWKEVKRVLRKHGVFVTTASQPFTSVLVTSNLDWFRYEWVWDKRSPTGFLNVKKMPMQQHNNIVVFSGRNSVYNPQLGSAGNLFGKKSKSRLTDSYGAFGDNANNGVGYPKTILTNFPRPNNLSGGGLHPTQKPVSLYEYLVKTYTNEGDTVLDFCMGSGTTGVACVKTSRNFIGIEKDGRYFEIAKNRILEAQKAGLNQMPAESTINS